MCQVLDNPGESAGFDANHSLTLTHPLNDLVTHSLTQASMHSCIHLFTHSLTHRLTHSLAHSLTHSPGFVRVSIYFPEQVPVRFPAIVCHKTNTSLNTGRDGASSHLDSVHLQEAAMATSSMAIHLKAPQLHANLCQVSLWPAISSCAVANLFQRIHTLQALYCPLDLARSYRFAWVGIAKMAV